MVLFVDKLEKFELGGHTQDKRKAEYILACHNKTFMGILNTISKTTKIPTGMFESGKYIISFNIDRDLSNVNFGILNSNIDIEKNFDVFADCFSPKFITAFHKLQIQIKEKIKNQGQEMSVIELSDNQQDFEIAYKNYLNYKHPKV